MEWDVILSMIESGGGDAGIGQAIWIAVLAQSKVKRLLSSVHFPVDGRLIEAWSSIKSFRRKDRGDNDSEGPGRNAKRSFHKEKCSNETHQSTTDPEARLYKKGDGQPAKLCHMRHALMENLHGLAVGGIVSQATGTAERETALALINTRHRRRWRITLGAGKAYDVTQFAHELRERSVTPHVAIDGHLSRAGPCKTRSTLAPPAMPPTMSANAAASGLRRSSR